jgi:proline dehydrogenase
MGVFGNKTTLGKANSGTIIVRYYSGIDGSSISGKTPCTKTHKRNETSDRFSFVFFVSFVVRFLSLVKSSTEVIPVRTLLLFLARQEGFKDFALGFKFFRDTASRFIAGETLEDAIRAVRYANQQRLSGTLDLLGENTVSREDADKAARDVIEMLNRIRAENVDCNVSVKLTQLGMDLDQNFCEQNLIRILDHARSLGNFIRVDMEDSRYTQQTLDMVERVHEQSGNVGAVIQSYLYRSEQDVLKLLEKRIRIRLVKGAYLEPEAVAFRKKRDTDANYVKLMKLLLTSDTYHALATHDEAIILAAKEFAETQKIPKSHFEFQMLYGIRRDLQLQLAGESYNVRIYIPYGQRWYPYFMRRLAERPANVTFVIRNLFKDRHRGLAPVSQENVWKTR